MKRVFEAVDGHPDRYLVRVIQAGKSTNGNTYTPSVLQQAVADRVFEGVRVFAKSDDEHIEMRGRSVYNLIGRISEARYVDDGVQAVLDVLASAGEIASKIREVVERKIDDLIGLSIDATVKWVPPKSARVVERLIRLDSLDVIVEASAGGKFLRVFESVHEEESQPMLLTKMIEAIKAKDPAALTGLDQTDEDKVFEAYQRVHQPLPPAAPATGMGDDVNRVLEAKLANAMRRFEARDLVRESKLPEISQARLLKQFEAQTEIDLGQVREAITSEREYLAKLAPQHVTGLGGQVSGGESQPEKTVKMWDDFFANAPGCIQSVRECYLQTTGDRGFTGRVREATRLREAVDTSSFDQVLGDAVTRRMLAHYKVPMDRYNSWRKIAKVVPINDFRTQHRTRIGGYGALPIVGEKDPYSPMTTPSDEEATYAVEKRGGTEEVSLESIVNDDVGAIREIPSLLSNAAQRTLARFVFDFIRLNPTLYDSVAWFHATHNNLGSSALSAATLSVGRLAILKMTEAGSAEQIGIPPINLLVSFDSEETAFNLFQRTTENDPTFLQRSKLNIIAPWYWTDANDWALLCDPEELSSIEIGFFGGREEPDLFTQDSPTSGSLFTHDKITYKLRHIYGGAVVNYRGGYKAVVA